MLERGFTLVELMIAVAVMSIVMAMAVPSLESAQQGGQVKKAQSALMAAATRARSEAISRGAPVSICASGDAATCDGDWTGFLVFEGLPPAGSSAVSGVIEQGDLSGVTASATQSALSWSSVGSANQTLSVSLCAANAQDSRHRGVSVSLLGRALVSRDYDDDGVHEDPTGSALTCD